MITVKQLRSLIDMFTNNRAGLSRHERASASHLLAQLRSRSNPNKESSLEVSSLDSAALVLLSEAQRDDGHFPPLSNEKRAELPAFMLSAVQKRAEQCHRLKAEYDDEIEILSKIVNDKKATAEERKKARADLASFQKRKNDNAVDLAGCLSEIRRLGGEEMRREQVKELNAGREAKKPTRETKPKTSAKDKRKKK